MKNNVIDKIKSIYNDIYENLTSPKNKMVRSKKSKDITMVVLRSVLLFGLCFVILFPTIQQISMALRAPEDVNNPAVIWIPLNWSLMNLKIAAVVLDYKNALLNTMKISVISMFLQIISTSLAGYAFSRLKFKGSNILFIFVILTIIIPPQALSLQQYLYFKDLNLIGNELSI
ncbi:MAG: carbohydrate ABC transporter permease, partial [Candidatus Izimaplasma sp.]|nr:carbohydrate ABC transporter permease [Candidatus Izimaplasma bacterium]